jgi:hypothetical protein
MHIGCYLDPKEQHRQQTENLISVNGPVVL